MTRTSERSSVSLLFFDKYNVEDPLFVADTSRRLVAAVRNNFLGMVVHDSQEAIEKVKESVDVADSARLDELLERTVRLCNQSVTRRMIDEGVASVSIQGSDRGLLRLDEANQLSLGKTDWMFRSIGMRTIPVMSTLAQTVDRRSVPVDAAEVLPLIVDALSETWNVSVLFFTTNRKPQLRNGEVGLDEVSRADLHTFSEIPEGGLSCLSLDPSVTVYFANSAGLRPDGTVKGTRVTG